MDNRKRGYKPSAKSVITKAIVEHIRQCGIMTAICMVAWQPYIAFVHLSEGMGWSERVFICVSAVVVHSAIYWSMNSFFHFCDRRRWLEPYKLERTEAMGPDQKLVNAAILEALVNQLVVGPPVFLLVVYPLAKFAGMPDIRTPLPPSPHLFLWFLAYVVVNDWLFYWVHRILHHGRIYGSVHKKHHLFKGTIGFAGEHAHAIEQLAANQVPAAAGFLFGGSHFLIFLVYMLCRLERVYEGHSGYCFHGTWLHKIGLTYAEATAYHDFHHTKNSGNFGSEYLDYFFGSMDAWIEVGGHDGYLALKRQGCFGNTLNDEHPSGQVAKAARKAQ